MLLNKLIRLILVLFLLVGCFTPTNAQTYDFVVYDRETGIAGVQINDIAQDRNGYIWVATNAGVSKFDGVHFTNFRKEQGLNENVCTSLLCDAQGNVWVGHQSAGVSIIYPDSIQTITEANGLANNEVRCIFQAANNSVWIATFGGVSVLEAGKWKSLSTETGLSSNNIQSIAQDASGNMWIGTYGMGISVLEGNSVKHIHQGNGLVNNYVTGFSISNDNLLVGTLGGITSWRNGQFAEVAGGNHLNNNQINDLVESEGAVWLATFGGAARIKEGKVTTVDEVNGLPKNEINTIMVDAEENTWLGTNSGLVRIKNLAFSHYFSNDETDIYPSSLFKDSEGKIWTGNEAGGVLVFQDGAFVSAFEDPDINDHQISAIAEDSDGSLWFGTMDFGGLFQWNGNQFYIYSDEFGLADNNINCLLADDDGILFIGTPNGLSTFDGMDFQIVYLSDDFASNNVTALEKAEDGTIFIGAEDGSVFRYAGGEATALENQGITSRITDIALAGTEMAIASKDDGIWFEKQGQLEPLRQVDELNGTEVRSLVFSNSQLIVGTANSMVSVMVQQDTLRAIRYGREQGFLGGSCKEGAILAVGEDVFVGTEKGMVILDPNELKPDISAPRTTITELQLSYESVDWQGKGFETSEQGLPINLSLSFTDNNLRFFFSGINHKYPEQVRYKWQLVGHEADFTPYSEENKVSYTNLSPGDYTFVLVACNSNNICSDPIEYSFSISPPFWKTWWFYTLLTVAIVVGAYLYVKQREQRLLEEKQILESTVEERTRELREQKEIVEHQNQHITESIEYASNIQKAILPSEEEMTSAFRDHFVFYRPKETVGGDFYWAYHNNGVSWAAAVDCTGHGVSGAFMSMIGSDLLNQIIIEKKITDPATVLEEMDKGIKLAFAQSAKEFESDQGMDVTLIRLDRKKNQLQFAGAQRPLFVFIDGMLTEIEGDRYSISCADETLKEFTTHTIDYADDAVAYLFSDGITDQFGGPKGKKFMVRRVREFLTANHAADMREQHAALIKTFDDWKGEENNQLDDVMLMGIRL